MRFAQSSHTLSSPLQTFTTYFQIENLFYVIILYVKRKKNKETPLKHLLTVNNKIKIYTSKYSRLFKTYTSIMLQIFSASCTLVVVFVVLFVIIIVISVLYIRIRFVYNLFKSCFIKSFKKRSNNLVSFAACFVLMKPFYLRRPFTCASHRMQIIRTGQRQNKQPSMAHTQFTTHKRENTDFEALNYHTEKNQQQKNEWQAH